MSTRNATLTILVIAAVAASPALAEEKVKAVFAADAIWRPRPAEGRNELTYGLEWETPFAGMTGFINPSLENPLNGRPLHIDVDLGIRFYPFAPAPRVFFVSPYIGGGYVNGIPSGALGVQAEGRIGVLLGLTLLLGDVFFLSAGVGGEYYNVQNILQDGSIQKSTENLGTVLRATVGFAI